jgi:hypothetical protein
MHINFFQSKELKLLIMNSFLGISDNCVVTKYKLNLIFFLNIQYIFNVNFILKNYSEILKDWTQKYGKTYG